MMFQLNDNEQDQLKKHLAKHDKKCEFANSMNQGAIGGRLTYMFTPTSLGMITKVKCACGKVFNLTDVSEW